MNQTYTVKNGDTLYGISNQFGVSVADILKENNVDPKNLQIGQIITIPNTSGTNPNSSINYIVKKGDTLYSIANKYGITIKDIINLNNLKSNNISVGQVLYIPDYYTNNEEKPEFINYIVKKGDSLYSIAKQNDLSVEQLIKDNSLNSENLSIGQNLKIRVKEILACYGNDYNPNETIYTVKKGDSLYKIANQYNTTVEKLININNLKNTNLAIGQQLIIPSNNNYYIVKAGDNLYSIAKKFNTTIDNLKTKNNLSSNILSIGQKIII